MSKLFEMSPIDSPSGGGALPQPNTGAQPLGKEEMIDFLADDEDNEKLEIEDKPKPTTEIPSPTKKGEEDERDDKESEPEGEEEEDELKELEEELEGPTDEQLELITPVRRKEILKKYPNLFKDFPYLEKAYYREQQFTELLPTIEDAKTAVEKANTLDRFESDVIRDGNLGNILKAVAVENPEAFSKIADNYLSVLSQVDEKAYFHVIGNMVRHTIISMIQESNRSQNEPLKLAAQILNQFVFGSSDFSPPTQLSRAATPETQNEENRIQQREQQFMKQAFTSTVSDLNTRVNNTLRNTIDAHIDPKKSMTDYVRKNASKDALDVLEELISKDTRFRSLTDKLWEKAINSNFSKESIDRIKAAYLSKAKTLLPSVIKKARNEALRGMGKRVREEEEEKEEVTTHKKGPVTQGRPRSQINTGKIRDPKDIPKGMSTLEFLNSD